MLEDVKSVQDSSCQSCDLNQVLTEGSTSVPCVIKRTVNMCHACYITMSDGCHKECF